MSEVVGLPNNSYKPITNTAWLRSQFCKFQKRCTRIAAANDKAYQLLAHGRWFSPASSTTKIYRHDIAEILLKAALKHQQQQIKSKSLTFAWALRWFIIGVYSLLRNVCRYQRGNQKPWIEEGQTTQWQKEKFVDTKGVIRNRESKKDRQHNGQKKSL